MKRLWLVLIVLIFTGANAAPIKITNVRFYPGATNRLVFDMSATTTYNSIILHTPERLVIDFKNTQLTFDLNRLNFAKSYIKTIRQAKMNHNNLRLIVDLRQSINLQHFILATKQNPLTRIVFDLKLANNNSVIKNKTPILLINKVIKADPALPLPLTEDNTITTKALITRKIRDVIVVIDPGHGGQDPGASGQRGTYEKNVTLPIGLDVRADLQKIPGIKVYMTRERDIYPSLGQRLALARKVKADLFISIHADAYRNRAARGASVFALSQGRATSVGARWIAESENRSELLGGVNLNDKSYMLRSVLVDLSQTATISESLKLGTHVKNNLGKVGKLHANRVEQASLYVLTSPDIPSILIETGFISNLQEELLLNSPAYQEKLADGITQGIVKYLTDNPVSNTQFAG